MLFNEHFKLKGKHAILGASKSHWLRYDDEKLMRFYYSSQAAARGTELHNFAAKCIELGQKLPRSNKTLNKYVNDAIGFGMTPEKILFYSDYAFGTVDAISFKNNILRIHDLKTGESPASMEQLMVYVAFFCLEYRIDPSTIEVELRIYQSDEVAIFNPTLEEMRFVIDRVIHSNKIIEHEHRKERNM